MNVKILLFIISIAAFSSCTTAYKSGQTPDDVYYSPAPVYEEEKQEEEDDRTTYKDTDEDREIRARIRSRRWRYEDDSYYSYQPYYNNTYVHYCYNPKGYYYYYHPKTGSTVTYYPRKFNFNKPTNTNTYNNPKSGNGSTYSSGNAPVRTFRKSSSGVANTIRKVLTPRSSKSSDDNNSSNSNSNSTTPTRTFDKSSSSSNNNNSSSSSSSSSGSSSSSSAPVRTFNK